MAADGVDDGGDQRTFWVRTAAADATASPSRWRCGDGDALARSVNSGVQIESGQKLTMWSGSQIE